MSTLGEKGSSGDDELVLVFKPPENPAAQVAVSTPFKGHRVRLEELLDWFKALKVDSIELWIEGAKTNGKNTELYLSTEGKTGAKITLRPHTENVTSQRAPTQATLPALPDSLAETSNNPTQLVTKQSKTVADLATSSLASFFSPKGGIEQQILAKIADAKESIEMAAYAFTNSNISNALLEASKRGVKTSLVMDKSQTTGAQASIHDQLEKAGIAVRLSSPPGGIMHDKFIIIDGQNLEWGSYNYTDRAENANFENATFLLDANTAQAYHSDFLTVFGQAILEAQGIARPLRRFWRRLRLSFNRKR